MGVVKTFLLPSYGFSFGYKRKGVSIAPLTEAQRNIVGQKMRVNAVTGRRYNPSVFSACETSRKASSPCTVGFRAPPVADAARKASRCRPQVRERTAEARAANGEGAENARQNRSAIQARRGHSRAEHGIAKVQSAVKPAFGGLPSSVTVQRKSAAPRHLPQGEGVALPRRAQNLLSAGAESGGLRSICRKVRRKPVRSPKNFLFCGVLGGGGLIITENSGIIKFTRREAPSYKMYFMRKNQYNY